MELTDFDVTDNDSQLVVIGTSGFVGTENLASYGANLDLFMNAINWMRRGYRHLHRAPRA